MEHITDADYKEKIASGKVVVDFYADWCGPCQMFAPVFESVAKNPPDITFLKCNVDLAKRPAAEFGVRSIPTIIAFSNGQVVDTAMGAMSAANFETFISVLK